MKPLRIVLTLLFFSGCSLFEQDDASTDAAVLLDLEEGQQKLFTPLGARLRFVEKITDSRCPLGGFCIWAGEATALLTLAPAGRSPRPFTLTWGWAEGQGRDADGHVYRDVAGFRITMLDLRPYPDSRLSYEGVDTITLRVQRRP